MKKPVQFTFSKPKWEIEQDNKVCETPIFSLHQIKLIPDQKRTAAEFFILNVPEWINIIAITPDNKILLVEQYRAGIDEPTLEIPGGVVDQEEDPLAAAKRELLEETGYASENWSELGKMSANPAIQNNYIQVYMAVDCIKVQDQQLDGTEDILLHQLPLPHFLELIKNGTVHHSVVLAAVAHLLIQTNSI